MITGENHGWQAWGKCPEQVGRALEEDSCVHLTMCLEGAFPGERWEEGIQSRQIKQYMSIRGG